MKIELSVMQEYRLARDFAISILRRIVAVRSNRIIPGVCSGDLAAEGIQEIRTMLKSIPDKFDRSFFIYQLRLHLSQQMEQKQMARRWQDYVKSQRPSYGSEVAA